MTVLAYINKQIWGSVHGSTDRTDSVILSSLQPYDPFSCPHNQILAVLTPICISFSSYIAPRD